MKPLAPAAILRLAIVVTVLLLPPWMVMKISDVPTPRNVVQFMSDVEPRNAFEWFEESSTSSLIHLLTGVIWMCWLWIGLNFLVDVLRLLVRRPLRHDRRLSARLALWALMISPTVVLSAASSGHATIETLDTTRNDFDTRVIPAPPVLVSALVVCGILFRLRFRRRRALRTSDWDLEPSELEWESDVDRDGHELALARVELAVRSLMGLAACSFRMLLVCPDSSLLVEFRQLRTPRPPWTLHAPRIWKLDPSVDLEELSASVLTDTGPLPVIVPVGTTAGGDVWINVQEVRFFGVHGEGSVADAVWGGLCQTLALSPFTEHVSIISTERIHMRGRREIVITEEQRVRQVAEGLHCTELPTVVLSRQRLMDVTSVVMVHRQHPQYGEFGLTCIGDDWFLQPTGTLIEPVRCTDGDLEVIDRLMDEPTSIEITSSRRPIASPPFPLKHRFVASILGIPHVRHVNGKRVAFERRRSEELVIWLAVHPERRRRTLARADMWNTAVKDTTFSNVVSDARRSLEVLESPPAGEEWIGVTLTDELPLHPLVISDARLLAESYDHARRWPENDGRRVLEFALGLVTGVPFGGSNYLWRDATGLGSEFAGLVVRAALLLADMYVETSIEDLDIPSDSMAGSWIEGVYWATAKGLLAVPGHEDLIIRRMELHARLGDHAALLAEWKSYCRVLTSDDWGDVEPSPKMVAAWRRLTRSTGITASLVEESVGL